MFWLYYGNITEKLDYYSLKTEIFSSNQCLKCLTPVTTIARCKRFAASIEF